MTIIDDFIVEENAFFIADSHFKENDMNLLGYFAHIPTGVQVFLMGDIFHLLVGEVHTSCLSNMPLIEQIAKLTFTNQVIILEGNHDFGLHRVWQRHCDYKQENLRIYSYCMQPLIAKGKNNALYILAHGDLWVSKAYSMYRFIMNLPCVLFIFRLLDRLSCGIIYKIISARIYKKRIAEFSFFRSDSVYFMRDRIEKYSNYVIQKLIKKGIAGETTMLCIIEGHYHLGEHIKKDNITYNALPSCYFHKKYLTFVSNEFVIEVVHGTRESI